jgi:phenylacetate-CoA ligase
MDDVAVHVEARPGLIRCCWRLDEGGGGADQDTIGLTRVVVEPPGTVERSVGKARRVVDQRPKD